MTSLEVRSKGVAADPLAVDTGTGWMEVVEVVERWRIEVGWWRVDPERPVQRAIWRVLLADGRCIDLRLDLGSRRWGVERTWG
ncbi:MAG: hypothetical protein WB801_05180 [Candidatus Dormiibacterota bacterium]